MSRRLSYKQKARLLMIPGLSGFLVFYVIPFLGSFAYAFTNNPLQMQFVGFANFVASFQNKYYMLALRNTVIFTIIGVSLIMLFSIVVSVMISTVGRRIAFIRMAFILPMLLPTAGVALVWRTWLNPNGALESTAAFFPGILGELFSPQMIPVYLMFVWKYCGFNIILLVAAIASIPHEVYESAALDGASGLSLHVKITIPMIRPTVFFATILSITNSFRIYKEMYYFYGTDYPPDSVYMLQYYMNNLFNKINYQMLSAGAILFALIVFVIVVFGYWSDVRS